MYMLQSMGRPGYEANVDNYTVIQYDNDYFLLVWFIFPLNVHWNVTVLAIKYWGEIPGRGKFQTIEHNIIEITLFNIILFFCPKCTSIRDSIVRKSISIRPGFPSVV